MMELGPSEGRDRVLPNLKCTERSRDETEALIGEKHSFKSHQEVHSMLLKITSITLVCVALHYTWGKMTQDSRDLGLAMKNKSELFAII